MRSKMIVVVFAVGCGKDDVLGVIIYGRGFVIVGLSTVEVTEKRRAF